MPDAAQMQTLITEVTKLLVDEPAQVSVTPVEERGETVLELRVAPGDLGKVIGKQGRTARSLRAILAAATYRFDERYTLEIIEEDE
jgi:predicted RNA-binding protein YlqC (UPF0109 family)